MERFKQTIWYEGMKYKMELDKIEVGEKDGIPVTFTEIFKILSSEKVNDKATE